jgi:hypothetical protein
MAASPTQFPGGAATMPPPHNSELQLVPLGTALFAAVNFSTPSLPQEADWDAACALATAPGALPAGFALDSAAPPTLAI